MFKGKKSRKSVANEKLTTMAPQGNVCFKIIFKKIFKNIFKIYYFINPLSRKRKKNRMALNSHVVKKIINNTATYC